jgi:hypothetical protein
LLSLLAAALVFAAISIWSGLGTSVTRWIGVVLAVLAVVSGTIAVLLRIRLRRAIAQPPTETEGSRG